MPPSSRTQTTAGLHRGSADLTGGTNTGNAEMTMFALGAEFVAMQVHARTREIRVPRTVGAFAAGRIVNPRTAHRQPMGGMIWGVGSALHEHTEIDRREARCVNDKLAEDLIPVNANIGQVDAILVPETDPHVNLVDAKGLGTRQRGHRRRRGQRRLPCHGSTHPRTADHHRPADPAVSACAGPGRPRGQADARSA